MWELDETNNSIIKNVSNVIIKTNDASRVIVSNENTEIVNKLKTSGGIIGLSASFSYTSDMIGYSFVSDSSNSTFTSGVSSNHTVTITTGVWLLSGGHVITKGSGGSFTSASYTELQFTITSGTGDLNKLDMNTNPIPSGSTLATLAFPVTPGIVICKSANCTLNAASNTVMTVGTGTARLVRLILTRIA